MAAGEFHPGDAALAARLVNTACIRFCHPRLTARNQLKSVFAKTDTYRQRELVALLLEVEDEAGRVALNEKDCRQWIAEATERFARTIGCPPTIEDIARELNVSPPELMSLLLTFRRREPPEEAESIVQPRGGPPLTPLSAGAALPLPTSHLPE